VPSVTHPTARKETRVRTDGVAERNDGDKKNEMKPTAGHPINVVGVCRRVGADTTYNTNYSYKYIFLGQSEVIHVSNDIRY
jgi:hypothetical protein